MELNPYLHYLIHQERSTDAIRGAEKWRLMRSPKMGGGSPGWLRRLSRGRLVIVRHDNADGKVRPEARQSATSPTA